MRTRMNTLRLLAVSLYLASVVVFGGLILANVVLAYV
jgi:hypothetical protein